MTSQIDCLPTTNPTETATWTPVTSSPNTVSNKNPLDVISLGVSDSGQAVTPSYTPEGHAEVAIHDPILPFGAVHTENLHAVFQTDPVYGLNLGQVGITKSGSGVATAASSFFKVSTGTTIYSQAVIQSRKRLRYRAGQGVVGRFTALYSTPAASSYQVVGYGHPEDGYFFGYVGTQFGILKSERGVREIQTLTIATASSTSENVTVSLNGANFTVAVTNSGVVAKTVYELSTASYTGWSVDAVGSTVRFLANTLGNKTGSFTVTGTTISGAFTETLAGETATETFIPQTSWNVDPMDGTGPSGVTLDPLKGNVYQIGIQYLGFGAVVFRILIAPDNGNNPTWQIVHVIKNPNSRTTTHVGNPAFPFTMAAYSAGSTADMTVSCGSFAGFLEGRKTIHGNRFSYVGGSTAVADSSYKALFTVKNGFVYGGRSNQSVINIFDVGGAVKHNFPVSLYLIRGATLAGTPSFSQYSSESCSLYDTAATTCTFSNNNQLVWSGHLGDTGNLEHQFYTNDIAEITLQPGETMTLAARSFSGSPTAVIGTMNTREDQ